MKRIVSHHLLVVMLVLMVGTLQNTFAINSNQKTSLEFHYTTESFKVYGKCKDLIEGSLKDVDGIKVAKWDEETQILTVTYNPHALNLTSVKQKVADSGHDTDTIRATDDSYKSLAKKCSYKRAKAKDYENNINER